MATDCLLTLRLDSGADEPIAGSLRDECGEEHRFTGWLGLFTLLERTRLVAASEPAERGESRGGAKS
jgi:hypothetical protein